MEKSELEKEYKTPFGILSDGGRSSKASLTKKVDVPAVEKSQLVTQY